MGSGASTFGPEDGQFMYFNGYPQSKIRPQSHREKMQSDPNGEKEKERLKIRQAELISKEKYENYVYGYHNYKK